MKKQLTVSLFILLFLIIGTIILIFYGQGYRIGFNKGSPSLDATGILSAESIPKGAQVYVNDHLTATTNNSINLAPGQYTIKISKEGYNNWEKNVQIKVKEVSDTNALLFPKAPTLQGISAFGVSSPVIDPSGTKLAFRIASQSAKKNGIYVLDMTAVAFPVLAGQSSSNQIANDSEDLFSEADITWSPDGQQILASVPVGPTSKNYYLLKADSMNETPQNVTATLASTHEAWKLQKTAKEDVLIKTLKSGMQSFAKTNFKIISWSPDETKILYQASTSATVPIVINPRRIGNNLLYEKRDIVKNAIYVYDVNEDVNKRIIDSTTDFCVDLPTTCESPFTWFPDSSHLIYVHNKKIEIVEDDGANTTTIYAGPFVDSYVYPWPDGSKIVILTNLGNNNIAPTLYTISLK